MKVRLFALASTAVLVILGAAPASAASPKFDPPKSFYLGLGDSLAFGFQQAKFNSNFPIENPNVFNTGFVDDLSVMLRSINPSLQTVNLGCPGETTATFIQGGCPYTAVGFALHNAINGDQLDTAVGFLTAHPGQVSPITIDLGANDVSACALDPTCIAAAITTVGTNMNLILGALRAAAPSAEIIVMEYYNPFAVLDPSTNTIVQRLNGVLADAAAGIGGRVADAFTPFNLAPIEPGTLCALTLFCTSLNDVHASDLGYIVIAEQFFAASGYARLSD